MAVGFASNTYLSIFGSRLPTAAAGAHPSMSELIHQFPDYKRTLSYQYPLSSAPRSVAWTSNNVSPNTDYIASVGFKWRMEIELAKAIEDQYLSTNVVLKSLLFDQSQLLWHLKGMTEFYFMMQGEVMHSFSTNIFHKVCRTVSTAR